MNRILNDRTLHYLENQIIDKLSLIHDFQNKRIINSPRSIGDTVQEAIGELLPGCFPDGLLGDFNADFARRAMADVAFTDIDGNYYLIDVKTHNTSTQFNMPNLTSVQRLARFYEDDRNYFVILLIDYSVENEHLTFTDARFIPIEHLEWSCLTIGALGWGQIQIANSNIVHVNRGNTRVDWMLALCDALEIFYPNEIAKINERIDYFQYVRVYWEKSVIIDFAFSAISANISILPLPNRRKIRPTGQLTVRADFIQNSIIAASRAPTVTSLPSSRHTTGSSV